MQALARLRGQVVRMRATPETRAEDALDLVDEALQLVEALRVECGSLQQRCVSLEAGIAQRDREAHELLDAAPPLIVTDSTGTIVDVNRAASALLGRSTPRLKQELLLHFFDDRAAFGELVRALSSAAPPADAVLRVRPRERAPFDAEITIARDPRSGGTRWLWFLARVSGPQTSARTIAPRPDAPPPSHQGRN